MVLSRQPGKPLETTENPENSQAHRPANGAVPQRFELSVRSHVERVARMQSGWVSQHFKSLCNWNNLQIAVTAVLLFAALGLAAPAAHGQSASSWNRRGLAAESREDYDAAFEAYRQAHLKKPGDLRYKERYERIRFLAAATHVDRGRVLRQSGDSGGAVNEFTRALEIDPGNQSASQELQITLPSATGTGPGSASAVPATPNGITTPTSPKVIGPGGDEQTPHQRQVQREIHSLASPVELQPVSNDPITLHMVEDTKVIYQAIGKAAGLNVIFDPDYTSKRIQIDLNSVTLWDALRITGTLSKTFWKPITANTLYVADNTNRQKRTDIEDLAVQTFYLTNVSQQNDANEVLIALRNLLDPSVKIYLVASQNAIVLRATPDQLVLAEKLINDLDRTRSEVVVDVAVLEVSRDKIRNLGITLPTSFGLTPQLSNANTNTSGTATSGTNTGNGTTPSTNTSTISLNTLGNLTASNFSVSLTGGTVNALLSDSDTRILQNPRIRATDGQRATLKIGSKIPVATGSYSAGAAITSASLGVQTQFQYLDVGVNIDMTPTVHYDREISLKMKIEVSAQNGSVTITGVTEPIISQRTIEQVIQLREGEPSILAGILQKQDTHSINGTPGLGEIPFLKYFFSTQGKEQQSDEIVFLLIPHIVRSSILTEDNTKPIYTGTGQSIELIRHEVPAKSPVDQPAAVAPAASTTRPNPAPTTAANAAAAMAGQLAEAARPPTGAAINNATNVTVPAAGTPQPSAAAVAAGNMATMPVSLALVPPTMSQAVGSTFQVALTVSNANDLYSVPVQMHFDPKVLSLVNVDVGELLGRDGQAPALVHRDEGNGSVTLSASRPPSAPGVNGQGTVATLTFKAIGAGDTAIALTKIGAKDSRQNSLPAVGSQASVHVK